MRRILLFAAVLSGCAVAPPDSWIAPEAVRMPGTLVVRLPAAQIGNPADLADDLRLDPAGFREWIRPILREQIALACRVDTVLWADSVPVVRDTVAPGWDRYVLERPAGRPARGWIMVLSDLRTGRVERQGRIVDGIASETQALSMGASWLIVERATGRPMASGFASVESPFRGNTDRSNWEDAASSLGQRIGERLPRR